MPDRITRRKGWEKPRLILWQLLLQTGRRRLMEFMAFLMVANLWWFRVFLCTPLFCGIVSIDCSVGCSETGKVRAICAEWEKEHHQSRGEQKNQACKEGSHADLLIFL